MSVSNSVAWRRVMGTGVIAGLLAAITIEVFLYIALLRPGHVALLDAWRFIASTALGKGAFTLPAAPWIGLFMHFAVSVAWGIGYAYLAQTRSGIDRHFITSGLIFGLVVFLVMQFALMAANAFHRPTAYEFLIDVLAHTIFFGLPLAVVVRALDRA